MGLERLRLGLRVSIITFLSEFGPESGYPAAMKGVAMIT